MQRTRLITMFVLLLLPAAWGQGAVGVQPNAIILEAAPGEAITQELRIDNPGGTPLNLSVYPGDWQYDGSGQVAYFPAGTLQESAAGWLVFDDSDISLEGRGRTNISYTVEVPEDAAPGTHWAALFIEGTNPATGAANPLASFRIRTAHMVYVNVPPLNTDGQILAIQGTAPESASGPFSMQLDYLNEGNSVQVLSGTVEIRRPDGSIHDTVTVERELALPGTVKPLNMELYGPMPQGEYVALAILNYGDPTLDVAAEFLFQLPHDLEAPKFRFDGARERVQEPGAQQ